MKHYVLILNILLAIHPCYTTAQQIDLDEAAAYVEHIVNEDIKGQEVYYKGEREVDILLNDKTLHVRYLWEGNPNVLLTGCNNQEKSYNELEVDLMRVNNVFISEYDGFSTISINCTSSTKGCIDLTVKCLHPIYSYNYCDNPSDVNHFDYLNLFYLEDNQTSDISTKVLEFLVNEVKRKADASKQKLYNLLDDQGIETTKEVVHYKTEAGVAILPISIDGLTIDAILDSGASSVSISKTLEKSLLNEGIISKSDYIEPGLYRIADGSISLKSRLIIPHIDVGNVRVYNVLASVNPTEDIILLGGSFLNAFKSWKINTNLNQLILEY